MSQFTTQDIEKLAALAQLKIDPDQIPAYSQSLSTIVAMISEIEQADTTSIAPLTHAFNTSQRMRDDKVTEANQRELFQSLTPHVAAGLYLVPRVVE